MFLGPHGGPVLAVSLDLADGLVQTVRAVTNPDKLCHLDPGHRFAMPIHLDGGGPPIVTGRPAGGTQTVEPASREQAVAAQTSRFRPDR